MRLIYWVAQNLTDHPAYNIRAIARKEVLRMLVQNYETKPSFSSEHKEIVYSNAELRHRFSAPKKITVEYDGAFDLIEQALGEGGIE